MSLRHPLLYAAAVFLAVAPAAGGSRKDSPTPAPASTFYDVYLGRYLAAEPAAPFARERAALRALGERDIDTFDWSYLGKEPAWFNEIQTLRFLLPWLATPADEPRARRWFTSWYVAHCLNETSRPAWGSGLACAQRALVLVFWLDHAQRRDARDEGLEQMLGDALRLHGQYLSAEEGFDGGSNVGVLEAIALRDMARRNHSKDGLELATRRLLSTLAVIVSPSGTTLEHSAHYHFIVLAWLEAALASEPDGRATASIRAYVEKMRRAGYFLLDSTDRVVQIGDSDSTVLPDFSRRLSDDLGEPGVVFFDSLAGFAAFKPARSSTDGRYVLYRIQRAPIALPAHCHADAMSLVVVWNGETILGDSGRYTYDGSGNYFASHPAHNSIFPQQLLFPTAMRVMSSVVRADHRRTGEGVFFRAEMDWHGARTARGLSIPSAAQTIVVNDTLRSDASSGVASRFCWTWNAGNDVRHVKLQSIGPDSAVWTVETHRRQRFEFRMTVSGTDSPMEAELLRGASRPELGWSSPTYGVKRPSWVVLARIRPGPMVTVRTVLERIR